MYIRKGKRFTLDSEIDKVFSGIVVTNFTDDKGVSESPHLTIPPEFKTNVAMKTSQHLRCSFNGAEIFEKFEIGQNLLDCSQEGKVDVHIFKDLPNIFKQLSFASWGKSV